MNWMTKVAILIGRKKLEEFAQANPQLPDDALAVANTLDTYPVRGAVTLIAGSLAHAVDNVLRGTETVEQLTTHALLVLTALCIIWVRHAISKHDVAVNTVVQKARAVAGVASQVTALLLAFAPFAFFAFFVVNSPSACAQTNAASGDAAYNTNTLSGVTNAAALFTELVSEVGSVTKFSSGVGVNLHGKIAPLLSQELSLFGHTTTNSSWSTGPSHATFFLPAANEEQVGWTNHHYNSGGSSGKGGGQVSAGEKDYRTFAIGLCIGPVDRINEIWYDNKLLWTGSISIASASTTATTTQGVGSVLLTDNANRGTICFYFGLDTQTQDPILAQFISDAPSYRGMCYAVFHGPRDGTLGFRIGNADTLCQIAINVTRIPPAPPGTPFSSTIQANAGNAAAEAHPIAIATDVSAFTGGKNILYALSAAFAGDPGKNTLPVSWSPVDGFDTSGSATAANGVPFAVGSLGLMVTLSWDNSLGSPLNSFATDQWSILANSEAATANSGANIASMLYELLTNYVSGFALPEELVDAAQFNAFAAQCAYAGLNYMTTEKGDARNLVKNILVNVQGALSVSNGLLAPRLMGYIPGSSPVINLTLEADDIVSYRMRPGAWYELPTHVTIKYPDSSRLYRDTVASLSAAGDVGDDEKTLDISLPMVTDLATARVIGLRMKALEALPKKADTVVCKRAAFPLQFGDVFAINAPVIGTVPAAWCYQPNTPLVVLEIREHGKGDGLIEIDLAPDLFGFLPANEGGTGSGGQGVPVGPGTPFNSISVQDLFEFPFEWATDGSRKFTVFASRPDPDAQGFTLWASIESPPVDYSEVFAAALYCAGGIVGGYTAPRFTMDREATIDFTASSDDIDTWQSVSDTDWFGYQFLVLLGGSDGALLFAAKELLFLGGNSWRIRGLWGPLSDTLGGSQGVNIWIFKLQPPYNVAGQPAWINGSTLSLKGIPYGSRLSPTLSAATAAQHIISSRALRPRMVQNARANAVAGRFAPTYSTDIALSWDLCSRVAGFGVETFPSMFDPTIACEVQQCQVDVVVAGSVINSYTANTRATFSTYIAGTTVTNQAFPVHDVSGLQAGDAISIFHGGGEWFGRIASIVDDQVTLISPLAITPSDGDVVNRYEASGLVYTAAMNTSDNGSLPASVTFNIYAYMNGLRSLRPATITVVKL